MYAKRLTDTNFVQFFEDVTKIPFKIQQHLHTSYTRNANDERGGPMA